MTMSRIDKRSNRSSGNASGSRPGIFATPFLITLFGMTSTGARPASLTVSMIKPCSLSRESRSVGGDQPRRCDPCRLILKLAKRPDASFASFEILQRAKAFNPMALARRRLLAESLERPPDSFIPLTTCHYLSRVKAELWVIERNFERLPFSVDRRYI